MFPSRKSVTEWKEDYPEIAKAVGGQRGGKYLKRIPKPGGGYRYVYKREVGRPVTVEKVHEAIGQATGAMDAVAKNSIDKAERAIVAAKKAEDPTNDFMNASSAVNSAQRAVTKMGRTATSTLNKYLAAKKISFTEGNKAIRATENRINVYHRRLDKLERKLDEF